MSGWKFSVSPANIPEEMDPGEDPGEAAIRFAIGKAEAASRKNDHCLILAADTIVVFDSQVLGKPESIEEAGRMLRALRGSVHKVITALVLLNAQSKKQVIEICSTNVPMRNYSDEEIKIYLASGSPMDKAGAYGIQDYGFQPVQIERIRGCFTNVMGLPLCHLQRAAEAFEISFTKKLPSSCSPDMNYGCALYGEVFGR